MDFDYSEVQKLLKTNIRKFTEKEFSKEYARYCDENEQFPDDAWKKMGELKYFGVLIPEEYGGLAGDAVDLAIIVEELARGAAPLSFAFVASAVFGGITLSLFGSEEQRRDVLPGIIDGSIKIALGSTEPNCGTDIFACETFASLDGDHYILNGQKTMITLATLADYVVTVAKTERGSRKRESVYS